MINQIISHQKSNLFLNFANIKGCRSGTCGVLQCNLRRVHTLLMASCSGRNLIGRRTQSDRAADAIRSGGGRYLMAEGALSGGTLRGCTCLKCTNRAAPTKLHQPSCTNQANGERVPTEYAEHTEPSGREVPPTDRHRCAQIRRVWHPCHTHAANNAA